jgi:hypothetical protein
VYLAGIEPAQRELPPVDDRRSYFAVPAPTNRLLLPVAAAQLRTALR